LIPKLQRNLYNPCLVYNILLLLVSSVDQFAFKNEKSWFDTIVRDLKTISEEKERNDQYRNAIAVFISLLPIR
jgi:hypothetical protein